MKLRRLEITTYTTLIMPLFGHLGHVASNTLRSLWLGITNGRLSTAPTKKMKLVVITNKLTGSVPTWRYFLMLPWGVLGGSLKRRERISARLGDIF